MYFAKARKQLEEQDMREVQDKLERYQRSDTARVQLQPKISTATRTGADDVTSGPGRPSPRDDFRPDELPDGAFVSPKHTPSHSTPSSKSSSSASSGRGADGISISRTADYIGSFSVNGSDEETRAQQVETQLEALRNVTKSKDVVLTISLDGVKVGSADNQTVYMVHELKRISYATCDPEHCQFSFLAREKQMNLQYCHAFLTRTEQQAEELNLIIGNAFKMAYAQQRDKRPTFHELIQAQVVQQQARFRAVEKQAQVELQRKLAEIARPTPFSQTALNRMEMRRQTSEDSSFSEVDLASKNKLWARQAVDSIQHRISALETTHAEAAFPGQRKSQPNLWPSATSMSACDLSDYAPSHHRNISKHNSAPLFPDHVPSPSDQPPRPDQNASCVIPHHPLSAQAIRVSMETKKDGKFKGSPVTALKNEIDKRFLCNGAEIGPLDVSESRASVVERETDQKSSKQETVRQQIHMAQRPLPSVPPSASPSHNNNNVNNNNSRGSPRQRPSSTYQCRSFDDHSFLPSSSSSPSPLSCQANGVSIRNSPRRKQPRPMSEIVTSSAAAGGKGYDNWHPTCLYESPGASPKQSPRHARNSSASLLNQTGTVAGDEAGMYMYGPCPGIKAEIRAGGKGHRFQSSQGEGSGGSEPVLRYQNDSPFHVDDQEAASRTGQGLESLMCLDRSHIEDPALRQASWYQAGIPREIALEILQQEEVGSFIIRDSTTHPGCFALSVRVPKFENSAGISHYLILNTHRGVKLKGLEKEWPTLTALVTHHTVMAEMLPCTLRLPRNNKNLTFRQAEKEEPYQDSDYQRLSDVTSQTAQLKL